MVMLLAQSEIKAFKQFIKIHSASSQTRKHTESWIETASRRMLSSVTSSLPSISTVNQLLSMSRSSTMTLPHIRSDSRSTRSTRIIRCGAAQLALSATPNQAPSRSKCHRNSDCHHSVTNLSSLMQARSSTISVCRILWVRVPAAWKAAINTIWQ